MKTYLSIDIDYWNGLSIQSILRFFENLLALSCPLLLVNDHHSLLHDMNQSDCDTLINVDYHSDVSDQPDTLNCGTWGNFVNWQHRGTFVWRYPSKECVRYGGWGGYCHEKHNPFEEPITQWAKIRKQQGICHLPWSTIHRIGVAWSLDWLHDNHLGQLADQWANSIDLIQDETYCRTFSRLVLSHCRRQKVAA